MIVLITLLVGGNLSGEREGWVGCPNWAWELPTLGSRVDWVRLRQLPG